MSEKQNFDKFLIYDSAVAGTLTTNFTGVENWIATVTYIHFSIPDGTYEDQNAYLHVNANSIINSTVTQNAKKPNGTLMPIMFPNDLSKMKIKSYIKGRYSGSDEFKFAILDKNLQIVPTTRIIVHLHVFNDTAKVLHL